MPAAYTRLNAEELLALAGEDLPARAVDSLLRANVAAPANLADALRRAVRGRRRDGARHSTR